MADKFDVIVIGAGPGGYVCAIRCAQLGMNVGCIPSKALLHASERYEEAGHHLKDLGVNVSGVKLDLKAMMKHKQGTVDANTQGIEFLMKKNKITKITGAGEIVEAGKVKVGYIRS